MMLNALTIDIEDYFQVHAFLNVIKYEDWDKFECRIERNTDRILEILNEVKTEHSELSTQNSTKGTFFVLGWIAERYPDVVRRIQKEGHEIACHGYSHRLIYTQSKEEFREDIKKAKAILEDITGSEVIGYRAPSYSITDKSQWAFEVLIGEKFKYDSSIFPIHHDYYGIPNAPRFPFIIPLNETSNVEFSMLNFDFNDIQNSAPSAHQSVLNIAEQQPSTTAAPINNSTLITHNSKFIIEFPISTVRILGQNIPISGGGYFRLFPYTLVRKGLKSVNGKEGKPFIFYLHPWEIDSDQPRINGLSSRSNFRHYINLDKTESKFRRLLGDFQFSTIRQILIQNS